MKSPSPVKLNYWPAQSTTINLVRQTALGLATSREWMCKERKPRTRWAMPLKRRPAIACLIERQYISTAEGCEALSALDTIRADIHSTAARINAQAKAFERLVPIHALMLPTRSLIRDASDSAWRNFSVGMTAVRQKGVTREWPRQLGIPRVGAGMAAV